MCMRKRTEVMVDEEETSVTNYEERIDPRMMPNRYSFSFLMVNTPNAHFFFFFPLKTAV